MAVTQDWLNAQYSVVGSALIDARTVPVILAETTSDDYTAPCREVYQAISAVFLSGQPVDPVTVREKLGESSSQLLMQLMEITPTSANVKAYIRICKNRARISKLQEIGTAIADESDPEQIEELVDQAVKVLAGQQLQAAVSTTQALRRFFDRHNSDVTPEYLRFPFREFEDRLHLTRGSFLVVAGRPSSGKSALAFQLAWFWSPDKRVGIFSAETDPDTVFDRQIAHGFGIPMTNIKLNAMNENHWAKLAEGSGAVTSRKLEIISAAGWTVPQIRAYAVARRMDIVIVDYLQLLPSHGKTRYEMVTEVSMALHTMAQTTGITVIALSQLSRPDKTRASGSPSVSDLRESGQIEQDADAIFLLSLDAKDAAGKRRVLNLAKNKEGELGRMLLDFDGSTQTFSKSKVGYADLAKLVKNSTHYKEPPESDAAYQPEQFAIIEDDGEPLPFENK